MTLHQNILGVDIARDWIDIFDPASAASRRVSTPDLSAFTAELGDVLVVFEATGGYERPLMEALSARGIAYVRVNPRQAREFARATGCLAKTDKVDARILARMGQALALRPDTVVDPSRKRLSELVARRDDLVSMSVAETQRLAMAHDGYVRDDITRMLEMLKARKLAIEAEIAALIAGSEDLHDQQARLCSAPASVRWPPPCSWRDCRNWGSSTGGRLLAWPDWRHTPVIPATAEAGAMFGAEGRGSGASFTWRLSSPHAAIRSSGTCVKGCKTQESPQRLPYSPLHESC